MTPKPPPGFELVPSAFSPPPLPPGFELVQPNEEVDEKTVRRKAAEDQLARERAANPAFDALNSPGAAENALRGFPVLGGFLDEARAGVSAGANWLTGGRVGQPYDDALEYARARYRREDAENPVSSTATKLAGGVAMAPLTPVLNATTTLGRIAAGGVTGAAYGAGHGFAEGEGGFDERLNTAGDYAAAGGMLGVGMPLATSAASGTFNAVRTAAPHIAARLPGRNADAIADDIVRQRIERGGTTPQAVQAELQAGQDAARFGGNSQAQLPEMIADTSDVMQRLTGSVYRQGGEAGEVVRRAIEGRQRGEPNQISRFATGDTGQRGQIDDALSRALQLRTSASARATERQIAADQASEGRRLYDAARNASEAFDLQGVIDGMVMRVQEYPPGIAGRLQKAIDLFTQPQKAGAADAELAMMTRLQRLSEDMQEKIAFARNDRARERLTQRYAVLMRRGQEDLATLRAQHNVFTAQRKPVDNIARFDAAKQELDDMIDAARRGGENNLARLLTGFKNDLLTAVHAPNAAGEPTRNVLYQQARNAWGSAAENREAIELGRAALRENSEVSVEQFRNLTPGQQTYFRQGFLESARNALGARRSGNDATLPFQSARVQELLREIIPNTRGTQGAFADRSGRFGEYLSRQERMGQTRNRVLGNSATAQRQQDDAEFAADALSRVMMGLRGGTNAVLEVVGAALTRATAYRQDVALALARRLVEADPAAQARILTNLQRGIGPGRFQEFTRALDRAIPSLPGVVGDEDSGPMTPPDQPRDPRFQPPMRLGGPEEKEPAPEADSAQPEQRYRVDSAGNVMRFPDGTPIPDLSEAPSFGRQGFAGGAWQAAKDYAPEIAATLAGPVVRGVSSALTYAPRATAAAAGMLGLTSATSQAGDDVASDPKAASARALAQLYSQRQSLDQRRAEAEMEAKAQERTGRGPNYKAAMEKVRQISNELAGVDRLITEEQKRGSPEYQIEVEKKRKAAEEEQRAKDAATPTRERYAEIMPYVPVITGSIAIGLGGLLKARAISNFNKEIGELTQRWLVTVENGNKALAKGNRQAGERFATAAEGIRKKFDAKIAAGPGGTKEALEAGAGVSLVGAFAPEEVDFARAAAGSPLWESLRETVITNWDDTLKRAGIAIGLGMGLGHLGSLGVKPLLSRPAPSGYGPETDALQKGLRQRVRGPKQPKAQVPPPQPQKRLPKQINPEGN